MAGGIGITPMRALFETIDVPGERVTLLYRASAPSDVVFREELDEIAARRGAQIIYLVGRSSDPANAVTSDRLKELVPEIEEHDVYIWASLALSHALKVGLHGAGVPQSQIHEEEFSF
jgi:ferredoxin-NADP reductase